MSRLLFDPPISHVFMFGNIFDAGHGTVSSLCQQQVMWVMALFRRCASRKSCGPWHCFVAVPVASHVGHGTVSWLCQSQVMWAMALFRGCASRKFETKLFTFTS